MDAQKIIVKSLAYGITGGVIFGAGCLGGYLLGSDPVTMGTLALTGAVVNTVFKETTLHLAKKYHWNEISKKAVILTGYTLVGVALAVSSYALGIFGPIGLGIAIGTQALFLGFGVFNLVLFPNKSPNNIFDRQLLSF